MDVPIDDHSPVVGEPPKGRGFLGCGLSGAVLATILTITVVLFLFIGGPLWSARPGASHMGRIVWSYLAVVPLVAAAFLVARRWSWVQYASAVGIVLAGKLIITSSLYAYLTPGSVQTYSPAPVATESATPARPQSPAAEIGTAEISGVVREHGQPAAGIVVVARTKTASPAPGQRRELVIAAAHYDHPIYLATVRDTVLVKNTDGGLHNVRARSEHRTLVNVPLPAGGEPRTLPIAAAGVYELACDEHPAERATLVVVDREPAAITDSGGHFSLRELPAAACELELYRNATPKRVLATDKSFDLD